MLCQFGDEVLGKDGRRTSVGVRLIRVGSRGLGVGHQVQGARASVAGSHRWRSPETSVECPSSPAGEVPWLSRRP
jgi:hypothetical protein